MKKRLFACFMAFVLLFNIHVSAYAQVTLLARPFTGTINEAIAGTIVKYAIRRGFAANDPRIALTMQAVGKVVDIGISGGGAVDAALAIGGLPVWGTAALAIATVGAVGFGAYKIYKVMTTDPETGASVEAVKIVDTSKSADAQNADPATLTKAGVLTSTNVSKVSTTSTPTGISLVHYRNPTCDASVNSSCAAYPVSPPSRYFYQMSGTDGFPFNTAAEYLYIQWALICGGHSDCTREWTVQPAISSTGVLSGTYKLTWPVKDANGNPTGQYSSAGTSASASPRTDVNAIGAIYGATLGDAFDQLNSGALNTAISPSFMADLVNQSLVQAASAQGYDGLPVSLTDPVTPADFTNWQTDNPRMPISAADLQTLPTPDGASLVTISPLVSAANPHAVDTSVLTPPSNVNVINTPNVNVVNKVSVDFGADPGVTSLDLEPTPTASQIFKPVLDSVQSLAVYSVPSHPSECPKPKFEIFDKSIVMDAHCTLLDSVKPTLFSVMAAVWVVIGIIIVLGA